MFEFDERHLSEEFKKEITKVRKEIKNGRFSRYNNSKELCDELNFQINDFERENFSEFILYYFYYNIECY